jgi:putative FmdB family regulatory protein
MPIYRYKCNRCGTEFRELVPLSDGAQVRCPACGSTDVTKLFSRFGVVYKGNGFYTTEYRRKASQGSGEGSGAKSSQKKSEK